VPGFGTAHHVDSSIDVFFDADDGHDTSDRVPPPAELSQDYMVPIHTSPDSVRPTRVRVVPTHFEDYVAHVSTVPHICVTDSCESDLSNHVEDILPLPDFSLMVAHPRHT
jgi:hypothetical protein